MDAGLISERQIRPFRFFLGSTLQQGTCFEGELYGLVYEFDVSQRFQAYRTATQLRREGNRTLLAASLERFTIWVSLRSPYYQCFAAVSPTDQQMAPKASITLDSGWDKAASCETLPLKDYAIA